MLFDIVVPSAGERRAWATIVVGAGAFVALVVIFLRRRGGPRR